MQVKQLRNVYRVKPMQVNMFEGGKFIAGLRKEAEKTQKELADLMGTSTKELSRIETGKNNKVDFSTICALALVFDIPVQEIAEAFGIKGLRSFSRKGE